MQEVLEPILIGAPPKLAGTVDEELLVGLVERFKVDMRVGKIQLLRRGDCLLFQPAEDSLNALALLFILHVIYAGAHEEPDAVGEEEVNGAGTAENLTQLINFDAGQLRVQVEATELWDEELEVRARRLTAHKIRVQAYLHEKIVCAGLVPVELDERVEYFTVNDPLLLPSLSSS